MAATPQYAGFKFVGLETGKTYSVDAYVSDVNGALVRFDGGGGAGTASPTEWICPEDCALVDYSQVTGTADTEKIRIVASGKPTQSVLRYVPHVTTAANRPVLNIRFRKGTQVAAIQISD